MKLLVSDFDGTYYLDDNDIKLNNKVIKDFQEKNNLFMLSSGRSYKSLKEKVNEYQIPYDYLSCCDGSILYDKNGNIIEMFSLDKSIIDEFLSLVKYAKVHTIQYSYPDDYYDKPRNDILIGCNIVILNQDITDSFINNYLKMQKIYPNYDFLIYSYHDRTFYCLKNKGINKSSTIRVLKDKLSLKDKDIYTVGDNDNDYYMLKHYNGYYIGNPSNNIKEVCLKGYNNVSNLVLDIIKGTTR